MNLNTITISDFKNYFIRDFPYIPEDEVTFLDPNKYVLDGDITKAFGEAQVVFNQSLFGTDANIRIAYLYLAAHYLVIDMRSAIGGIEGTGTLPVASRSVGNVSESYAIPQAYQDNPVLSSYTTTSYGMKYVSLLFPRLVGNVVAVWGGTRA